MLTTWAQVFLHSRGRGVRPGDGLGGGPGAERRSKAPFECRLGVDDIKAKALDSVGLMVPGWC